MIGKISLGIVAALGVAALGLTPAQENAAARGPEGSTPRDALCRGREGSQVSLRDGREGSQVEARPKLESLGEQLKKVRPGADPVNVHDIAVTRCPTRSNLSASKKGAPGSTLLR